MALKILLHDEKSIFRQEEKNDVQKRLPKPILRQPQSIFRKTTFNRDWIRSPQGGCFANLFSTSNPTQDQLEAALKGLNPKVSAAMNEELDQPFTEEEVTEALAQMCPTKAPGPDGLHAVFFQRHWQSVKTGVVSTCLHILNEKATIAPLNHTYIALIMKIGKPSKVTDFRPISLCNVIYRIITKAIANRLKYIL